MPTATQVPLNTASAGTRHTFVSLMSDSGMAVEEIARLAGHSSSRTTEVVYRHELRPVITTGAEVMDQLFKADNLSRASWQAQAARYYSSGL